MREYCAACKKPTSTCYCAHLRPFTSSIRFIILIHHEEVRRSVATGRMAHLCLLNSEFFVGTDFTNHEGVNALVADPKNYPVVLYPGPKAVNLSSVEPGSRARLFPEGKQLVVFILDGTWSQARKIRRQSRNLADLPQFCFTPPRLSRFLIRKQPHPGCYATIEAIHYFIELVSGSAEGPHRNLLEVFAAMVNQQVDYEAKHGGRLLPTVTV